MTTQTMLKNVATAFVTLSWLMTSCSDDPKPSNEEELITKVTLTFQKYDLGNEPVGEPFSFSWYDPDGGVGPEDPQVDDISLEPDTHYSLEVTMADASGSTEEDITEEIREEAAQHQLFYSLSGGLIDKIDIAYGDFDKNGKPVGLECSFNTSDASTGDLRITLRHKPKKNAAGVSDGDITNAGGDTDVEIDFDVAIAE